MYEQEALPHVLLADPAVFLHHQVPLGPVVQVRKDVGAEQHQTHEEREQSGREDGF